MSINTAPAVRVATTIATFKWIVVGGIALVGVIALLSAFAGDSVGTGLAIFVMAVLNALVAWVLFGWFEQTLRLLAAIADNTAVAQPGGPSAPVTYSA